MIDRAIGKPRPVSLVVKKLSNRRGRCCVSMPGPLSSASIASMDKVRRMMPAYHAKLFINHDKTQADMLKLLPAFYD
jgi:hypothetical protein